MNQSFSQIVFYANGNNFNSPGVTTDNLISGQIFSNYLPISQLGVQSIPGTKFYLNGNTNPVIVGFTGLFSIDLSSGGYINEIRFDETSIQNINNNTSAVLIIDMARLGG